MNFLDTRVPERLWGHTVPCPWSGCWLWLAARNAGGYGKTIVGSKTDGSRRYVYAHRLFYELLVGPIPTGRQLDHLCRVRCCVNPIHLEPVTALENVHRGDAMWISGARESAKTHCPRGHAYDRVVEIDGAFRQRVCMRCQIELRRARHRARQQAESVSDREHRNAERRRRRAEPAP